MAHWWLRNAQTEDSRVGPLQAKTVVFLPYDSGNPSRIHRDEVTGKILNLVFVWAEEGSQLKVDVPVVFKGEDVCPGLKKGGHLNRIRTSLKYLCPAEHIPSKIEVDVSSLDIGDRILMGDVEVNPSLKLLSKNESMPICKIVATKLEMPEPSQGPDIGTSTI
ncbi:50S ribosomal protein L25 [Morella rubra]|uniref:50S ribosomal protein L25 n=1 Tax=Morella rubra TaxID=262757 RepID=A0A6A1VRV1_9ROSI|nr:50S ribosomal protein L25 [Morella rubra]